MRRLGNLLALVAIAAAIGVTLASFTAGAAIWGTRQADSRIDAFWNDLPPLPDVPLAETNIIVDNSGQVLAEIYAYNRTVVPLDQISPLLVDAVIAIEDRRFREHHGLDWEGLGRAVRDNLLTDNPTQGASTITQQYVKNVRQLDAILRSDRDAYLAATEATIGRKIDELRYALRAEQDLTKDQILENYLNIVYFGAGAYGAQAAAERYFSIDAADLTLTQAATLAGLLQAPDALDPTDNPDAARERRNLVLQAMADTGTISPQQARRAQNEPLELNETVRPQGCLNARNRQITGVYCQAVLDALEQNPALGDTPAQRAARLATGGLVIETYLDEAAQTAAHEAAAARVPARQRVASAIAVIQPGTGHVAALAMNRPWGLNAKRGQTSLTLPTLAAYQPGSTFKPFTLAAALENGWNLDTVLPGGVTYTSETLDNPENGYYSNAEGAWGSNVTIVEATRRSLNTPYIQLTEQLGVRTIAEMMNRLGLDIPLTGDRAVSDREGTLTAGQREQSPLAMAAAYATFANGGTQCTPQLIATIATSDGQQLWRNTPDCTRKISRPVADTVTGILTQVVEEGTGTNARLDDRPVAGKTGTSASVGAAWFVGYTPQWVAAVWVGDPRGGPTHPLINTLGYATVYGGTIPALIWRDLAVELHDGLAPMPLADIDESYRWAPAATDNARVPQLTGMAAADAATWLTELGWRVTTTVSDDELRDGWPSGVVTASEPAAGTALQPGDTVTLTITP